MPKGATPDFSAKTVGGNSLSCPEATGDYTLDAIRRSTETLHALALSPNCAPVLKVVAGTKPLLCMLSRQALITALLPNLTTLACARADASHKKQQPRDEQHAINDPVEQLLGNQQIDLFAQVKPKEQGGE